MSDAIKARAANESKLSKNHNVVGTGVGKKWVNNTPTDDDAIIVFVKKKYSENTLRSQGASVIPKSVDGVPVDVIEVGDIKPQGFKKKVRPIKPGYSCGHTATTAGTIGGVFIDKNGDHVLLSNNHVAANENRAKKGDIILQPGPVDSRSKNPIAKLKKFIKLKKRGNTQDSAICVIDPNLVKAEMIDPIYPVINQPLCGFGEASVRQHVQKCGRTTGYTTGNVMALNASFTIEYDFGSAKFDDCIVLSAMSKGGDSGSIIQDMKSNAVGLLFAGSSKVTLANRFSLVRDYYGLELWKGSGEPVDIKHGDWVLMTDKGSGKLKKDIFEIEAKANHHCFVEAKLGKIVKNVSCTINTGSDSGATWGPGIVLQFPNGHLQVNLRVGNGCYGGAINNQKINKIGSCRQGHQYNLRIRLDGRTYVGEIRDKKWLTIFEVPASVFPNAPVSVRIGKTAGNGGRGDYHLASGELGKCSISDINIS